MIEEPLLSVKQLAAKLGRNPSYVRGMLRGGFRMVGGRTTLTAAIRWLAIPANSKPRAGER
jgi:hypothetical protein